MSSGLELIGWVFVLTAGQAGVGAALIGQSSMPIRGAIPRAALAWTLGSGLHTLVLFLISAVGAPLSAPLILASAVLPAVVALVMRRPWPIPAAHLWPSRFLRQIRVPELCVGGMLLALIAFQLVSLLGADLVGRPDDWDEVAIWAVKGEAIYDEQSINGARWGAWQDYPLHVPLLIATLEPGERRTGRLVAWLCAAATSSLMIGMMESRRGRLLAYAAALLLLAAPVYEAQARLIFANVPFALYVLLGFWALYGAPRRRHWSLAGIALGTAAWTRAEGILLVSVLALPALLVDARKHRGAITRFVVLLSLFVVPWHVYQRWLSPFPPSPSTQFSPIFAELMQGHFPTASTFGEVLAFAYASLLSPSGQWGLTWWIIFGCLGVFLFIPPLWRRMGASSLALSGYLVATLGMYAVVPQTMMPLSWWLQTGFDRVLLGIVPAALIWSAAFVNLSQRRALAVWLSRGRMMEFRRQKSSSSRAVPLAQ